jgi:hypothetical protein
MFCEALLIITLARADHDGRTIHLSGATEAIDARLLPEEAKLWGPPEPPDPPDLKELLIKRPL